MSNTRKIRKSTALASATLIAGATAFGIAGCNSTSTMAAPPPATTTTAPAAAATPASDTQVCNDVNTWEQNNDGLAASSFGTDAASQAIVQEASGTSAVDTDVQSLTSDSASSSSAAADISSLAADCAAAGVTLTGSDFSQAAPAPSTAASDTQVCNDVNTWEQNNDGLAATSFGTDAASQAIVQEASGSSAVDADVQSLSSDSGSSAAADISSLAADCAAAGVTLTGSDFSQAAPAPSSPAPAPSPAFTPATLLNASGSGGYTTQRFTVGGSGDYDVKWSYSEGSFGQSVNFQLWADGGSDFNFTDPNQLGTGGSGTVHVYGDAGTHSITVNTEGDWTISVVTTP